MASTAVGLGVPWSRAEGPFTTETLSAFDLDDGVVVAALLLVSVAVLVVHATGTGPIARWSGLAALIGGVAIAGIAIVDIGDVSSVETIVQSSGGEIDTTVGEGLYLVLAGGVAQVVGMAIVLGGGRRGPYGPEPEQPATASGVEAVDDHDAATGNEGGGSLGS